MISSIAPRSQGNLNFQVPAQKLFQIFEKLVDTTIRNVKNEAIQNPLNSVILIVVSTEKKPAKKAKPKAMGSIEEFPLDPKGERKQQKEEKKG